MGKNALTGIIRNDSVTITASITNPTSNNSSISINGWSAWLTVKDSLNTTSNENDDSSALLQVEQTNISDPTGTGTVAFNLTASQTDILPGTFVYDVQFEDPYGNVYSSIEDVFTVIGDVTRTY